MNQKGAAVLFFLLIVAMVGGIIGYDIIKNDRLHMNPDGQQNNWKWNNDWNNTNPPVQPNQPGPQPQQPQPQQPQRPQPPMNQITASSYSDALSKSGEYGMPVLAIFGADWCSWCKKMKNETLTDQQVKGMMMNYVVVHIDVDKDRSISRKFGVSGIPAYAITNWQEKNLKSGSGYKNAGQFNSWLNEPTLWTQPKNNNVQPQPQPQQPQPQPQQPRRRIPRQG